MTLKGTRRGEFDLIAEIFAPLAGGDPAARGLLDDAAVLPQRDGFETVVTTDTMVAGVHFLADEPPDAVGGRLLRVNLSDLAAMGAEPRGCFLNLSIPVDTDDAWLEGFAAGLGRDLAAFGGHLIGGDTTATPGPITVSLTALGEAPAGTSISRAGARPGDVLMVSGTIGDGALGLRVQQGEEGLPEPEFLLERFRLPTPRLALGQALRGIATAMADVSDGLVADAGHIAGASRVGVRILADDVPVSPAGRAAIDRGLTSLTALATGGDDYELVFVVPANRLEAVRRAAALVRTPVSMIGEIVGGEGVALLDSAGSVLETGAGGYRHR